MYVWILHFTLQPIDTYSPLLQEYYGKTLKKTSDLKSNACVPSAKSVPAYVRKAIAGIHPDVVAK